MAKEDRERKQTELLETTRLKLKNARRAHWDALEALEEGKEDEAYATAAFEEQLSKSEMDVKRETSACRRLADASRRLSNAKVKCNKAHRVLGKVKELYMTSRLSAV